MCQVIGTSTSIWFIEFKCTHIYIPPIVLIIEILITMAFVVNMPSRDLLRDWQKKLWFLQKSTSAKWIWGIMPCWMLPSVLKWNSYVVLRLVNKIVLVYIEYVLCDIYKVGQHIFIICHYKSAIQVLRHNHALLWLLEI